MITREQALDVEFIKGLYKKHGMLPISKRLFPYVGLDETCPHCCIIGILCAEMGANDASNSYDIAEAIMGDSRETLHHYWWSFDRGFEDEPPSETANDLDRISYTIGVQLRTWVEEQEA